MINLKLAQAVEATHYIDNVLYKFVAGELYRHSHSGIFDPAEDTDEQLVKLQRIDFTEPETVTKYVKVEFGKLSELVERTEKGEVFYVASTASPGSYIEVDVYGAIQAWQYNHELFCATEKPAYWKEVAREFIRSCNELSFDDELGDIINHPDFDPERKEFIELIKRIYPLVK